MTDRTLLTKRLQAIKAHPKAGPELLKAWPPGVLGVSKASEHQLDLIDKVMSVVEGANGMSFEPWEPEYVDPIYGEIPAKPIERPDEGDTVEAEELESIKLVLGFLAPSNLAFVEQMAGWAREAGHYIGFVNFPYRRRVEIAKALIALSHLSVADAFDIIATVTGVPDGADVGEVVGTLSIAQAKLIQMADTNNKGETATS